MNLRTTGHSIALYERDRMCSGTPSGSDKPLLRPVFSWRVTCPGRKYRLYNDKASFGPSVQKRLDAVCIYHDDMRDLMKQILDPFFYDAK